MINFCKFHGFGNDYIVVEAEQLKNVESVSEFAKLFCHRNYGVGSDGIAILEKLVGEEADYSCRIINPDGSEATFSGNGTRCAVAYLYYKNLWTDKSLKLITLSGLKTYNLLEENGKTFWFLAELGEPKFAAAEMPFLADEPLDKIVNYEINLADQSLPITVVNPGNPVVSVFTEDFESIDWREIGKELENHHQFPERTNVVFVKKIDANNIEIRIWERGAGETSSSGTCSTAAAISHLVHEDTRGLIYVHAPGGTTEITWREDGKTLIKGRADFAFSGEWLD